MLKPGAMRMPVPTGNKRHGREDSDEFFSRIADTPARAPMPSDFQVATQGQRLSQVSCGAHQNIKNPAHLSRLMVSGPASSKVLKL
jgi:hypothetical protein